MKIALITGANKGIGFATAHQLAQKNIKVLLGSRNAKRGRQAVDRLKQGEVDVELLMIDVSSTSSVEKAAGQVKEKYGRLDILVNNAGILPEATAGESHDPLDLDLFRKTFDTNLFGAVSVIQSFLPLLRKSDGGRIVNISTVMGSLNDQSDPSSPYYDVIVPAYQTSKAALNGITVALAKQLADTSIKINSVCPGFVQTDLTPQNRSQAPLTAEEAAQTIVKMSSISKNGPTGGFFNAEGSLQW